MAAIAAITLDDGETPPVVRTYSPVSIKGDLATWFDRTYNSGMSAGFGQLTASLVRPSKTSKLNKVRVKLALPTLITGGVSPFVEYTTSVDIQFLLPELSTEADRQNVLALAKNALAEAIIEAMVVDLDSVY